VPARNAKGSPRALAKKSLCDRGYSESWRLSRPCSGVTIESISRNRPPAWEDEAAVEPRLRRVQQGVPPSGRALPGMPLEMTDPEDDDDPRPGGRRFGSSRQEKPRSPWYRPASAVGRVFLALVAVIVLGGLGTSAYLFKTFLSRDSRFRIAGTSLALTILLFTFAGIWIDRHWGARPWGTVGGAFIGIGVGLYNFFREFSNASDNSNPGS